MIAGTCPSRGTVRYISDLDRVSLPFDRQVALDPLDDVIRFGIAEQNQIRRSDIGISQLAVKLPADVASEVFSPMDHRVVRFSFHPALHHRIARLSAWQNEHERIHEGVVDGSLQKWTLAQVGRVGGNLPGVGIARQFPAPRAIRLYFGPISLVPSITTVIGPEAEPGH